MTNVETDAADGIPQGYVARRFADSSAEVRTTTATAELVIRIA